MCPNLFSQNSGGSLGLSILYCLISCKKYCKRHRPLVVKWNGGSQVWKDMLQFRYFIHQDILWEPREGNASVWFDKLTQFGALQYVLPISHDSC